MSGPVYQFGVFQLDPAERRLLRNGDPVFLAPKLFEILTVLVERRGHLVSKADLMTRVWPDTVVEEANLTVSISALRKVLGADTIETVPKAGYRFGVPVSVPTGDAGAPAAPPPTRTDGKRRPLPATAAHRWWMVAGMVVTVIVVVYTSWPRTSPHSDSDPIALAVLPFADLGGDPRQEYFADGLTEEMITRLGRLQPARLRVIARTSSMHYKNTTQRVDEIARELGVAYVLEGSVRRDAGRVRISARLIDGRDQTPLWAETYDRDEASVHAIQAEVSERVARSLAVALLPHQRQALARASTRSPVAHEAYLRGRYHWNKRTPAAFERALRYFEQAIEADPGYAAAYAGLADTYGLIGVYAYAVMPPHEVMPKARAAALKALSIDDSLSEAHASLGWVAFIYDWDSETAERELRRSMELNPSYATARMWYSRLLASRGRLEAALAEVRRAKALDPVSRQISTRVGSHLYLSRKFEEAVAAHRKTLELEPDFAVAHLELGRSLLVLGRPLDAVGELERATQLFGEGSTMPIAYLARAQAESGRRREAVRTLEQLRALSRERYVPAFNIAMGYMGLGDTDNAFDWLTKACEERFYSMVFLNVDPAFDAVRGDPRFAELARCVGLSLPS